MGFFDADGASTVSRRSSGRHGSSSSKHHHHSSSSRKDKDRNRDHDRSPSRTRSLVTARSFFGLDDSSKRHHHSGSSSHRHHYSSSHNKSFFSLPNLSSRSIFSTFSRGGTGGSGAFSSYYRRSPRTSFMQRAYRKLKRLLRDLVYYAKRHPLKVFTLAVLPLITGGALTALLARFGLRLPPALERMLGVGARAASGDALGLVGDAMRMATGGGATGAGAAALGAKVMHLERSSSSGGRHGDMQWVRQRSAERDYFGGGDSRGRSSHSDTGSGWGGNLAGISKMFS
ncbi:hypothetical protein SPI_08968 [Niveomyces insectorum RCEF 264]|uniref:Uncharacterized protein n=1 Tax=Niveomyces insectorum RCEF 264 TaxID=1081102 RepID=A0A167MH57_9HYPO|nr:hypothetical protein SPI_08968 [Niveomyces insectorum RCEF 264]